MLDRFRDAVANLLPYEAKVLVAYSGGADSGCLLHLMHRCGFDVTAAHLHHGQRAEADEELRQCEAFCDSLGVPLVVGRADVPRMSRETGMSLEEAGRFARYHFFEQAAQRTETPFIVTGHTRDDLVETVLFNLTRGAGLAGLKGIPEQRGNIVRPLLRFDRAETLAYCQEHGIWTHDDPANFDLAFSRARIRHRALPELRAINPEVNTTLARFASIVAEEDAFLDQLAAARLELAETPLNGPLRFLTVAEEIAFDRETLLASPRPLLLRGLKLTAGVLGAEAEHAHIERIAAGIAGGEKGSETLPGGQVAVEWDGGRVHWRSLIVEEPFRSSMAFPGDTFADSFGWQITAFAEEGTDHPADPSNLEVALDGDAVRGELHFRSVKEGDRMAPLGMTQDKKLTDMLQEKRLTLLARRRLPLVCDLVGPIWLPGVAIAERVRLKPSSKKKISMRFGPISGLTDHNG